jgi:hypothetical protein
MTYTNDEAMVRLTAAALTGLLAEWRNLTVKESARIAVEIAAAALAELRKEHGSQEPGASPIVSDAGRGPNSAPSDDAQARPSSPAPSARGAGARWLQQQFGTWLCSKCGAWRDMLGAPEHERTCWAASPAVSARQDAGLRDPHSHYWPRTDAEFRRVVKSRARQRLSKNLIASVELPAPIALLVDDLDAAEAEIARLKRAPSSLRGEPVDGAEFHGWRSDTIVCCYCKHLVGVPPDPLSADLIDSYQGAVKDDQFPLLSWHWQPGTPMRRFCDALSALVARARALKMSSEPEAKS